MTQNNTADEQRGSIEATYEEYDVGDVRLAMIADPDNEHAWIQSDYTADVDP